MKKLLIVCALFFGFTSVQAQEIDLGIKAGANFASVSDAKDLDNKTGFRAGAFFGLKYDNIGIQPELIYSEQGGESGNDFGDFELNYVNIPVMFKYYIIGDIINVQVGPQFGFVVNDDLPDASDVESKDFDLSGAAGIGVEVPFGFRLEARYNFGLTDIADNQSGKNSVISVALGWSFL